MTPGYSSYKADHLARLNESKAKYEACSEWSTKIPTASTY